MGDAHSTEAQQAAAMGELGVRDAASQIAAGTFTARQLTQALIKKAQSEECKALNAYITLDEKGAMAMARTREKTPSSGPLNGVPIVVKDNITYVGVPTTGGTAALKDFQAKTNAPALQKLIDAGAVVIGKTNMHELAFGITSNNATFGAVGNAHNATCFAGGSSGGSAVAVAARMAPAGLGTDTGGSMRIPAALNGVVGFRPTTGRYPIGGVIPLSHTHDTVGPMARSVDDIVLLDGVMTDSSTTLEPASLSGLKLGLPSPWVDNLDPATAAAFEAVKARLTAVGVELVQIDLKYLAELDGKTGFPIVLWEAGREMRAFLQANGADVSLEDVAKLITSPDVKGTFDGPILSKDAAIPDEVYASAIGETRPKLQLEYLKAFKETGVAALLFPTTPLPAQPIAGSDETVSLNGVQVPTFPTMVRNTLPGATAGLPGLTLNGGWTTAAQPLPIGIEIDGPAFSDKQLLSIGLSIERALGSSAAKPHTASCTASCICGACQVETVGAPKWVVNCHCSQCRRALSATYATLAGFDPESVTVTKGESNMVSHTTGKEERFSCKTCSSKVYAHLHHLNHKAIYNDTFTTPNHGPDGTIGKGFEPTMHIFYTSGNTNVADGLPKYVDLPAAFGGSDKTVEEVQHSPQTAEPPATCVASCLCGACKVETTCAPKWVVNCHCSQCRRALSGSYATLAGFDPDTLKVTSGESNLVSHTTGKEERFSCKTCSSKVYAHLHHLNHKAIYNDMFTTPNHGPDGKIAKGFEPTSHIFYTSGNTNVHDDLPKFVGLPAAFGGSDKKVEDFHSSAASCLCGACQVGIAGQPKWVANCHCSQCRRAVSAPYATLAGFDPDSITVTKGESNLVSHTTGKEERFSCKTCSSKVYAHLHHLSHKAIYNDMFTTPNQGPDGKIGKAFKPTMHIFYTSGNTNVIDGLPKYEDLPAAFGGSDKTVGENLHVELVASAPAACTVSCLCGACQVETTGAPKWVANCHCSQCRRALSASYATLAGYDPGNVKVTKGDSMLVSHTTGKEERLSCKICSSKVYAHLHHLNHKAIYNDMFTTPNHGPDGKLTKGFAPTMHIFYTSGNTNVADGLPKFVDLPAAFGGSDKKVDDVYHAPGLPFKRSDAKLGTAQLS